jgi:hypothetical protein
VREHEQVLLDRERRVEVVELGHDSALSPRRLRFLRQPESEHLELALVGDRLRRQEPHRRRLAGPVRAQQADTRPFRHVEVEPIHRGDRTVALHHAAQTNRQVGHSLSLP